MKFPLAVRELYNPRGIFVVDSNHKIIMELKDRDGLKLARTLVRLSNLAAPFVNLNYTRRDWEWERNR